MQRLKQIQRSFATAPSTVQLAYEHFKADRATRGPLVMVHGLYGSKQNWRSIAKALPRQLSRDVYALDLRNHGTSPHAPGMAYAIMAEDIARFLRDHQLQDVALLGHSLGGKTVMALALHPEHSQLLDRLIVVDISAAQGPISGEFAAYLKAMRTIQQKIDEGTITNKKEADSFLQDVEPELSTRQFLLTNLIASAGEKLHWRISLDHLEQGLSEIGGFPYEPGQRRFDGPTLFIKGEKSKYINRKSAAVCQEYFPNMKLEEVAGVGHWVHAEKPSDFQRLVVDFCSES